MMETFLCFDVRLRFTRLELRGGTTGNGSMRSFWRWKTVFRPFWLTVWPAYLKSRTTEYLSFLRM